jgi:hypothetical protein
MKTILIEFSIIIGFASATASAQVKPETVVANLYKAGSAKSVGRTKARDSEQF